MGLISNGTTVFDAGAMSLGGSMTFIKKLTASGSANLSFVHGSVRLSWILLIKNIYLHLKIYIQLADNTDLYFNVVLILVQIINVTKTSTYFVAYNAEEVIMIAALEYSPGQDHAQATAFQSLTDGYGGIGADADQSCSGYLHLFNPSSTLLLNILWLEYNISNQINFSTDNHIAGYVNTQQAIDAVQI